MASDIHLHPFISNPPLQISECRVEGSLQCDWLRSLQNGDALKKIVRILRIYIDEIEFGTVARNLNLKIPSASAATAQASGTPPVAV